jgi:ABC-type nitrate/sulfonate/bicarbonate transport system permease component
MKKFILPVICMFLMTTLSSCGLMEDAFKAGFIIALIIAALIGLLVWIFHMSYKLLSKYLPVVRAFDGFWDE